MISRFDTIFKITQFLSLTQSALKVKKSGSWKIFEIRAFDYTLNCAYELTDVQASIFDRKIYARICDSTHDILRCLIFVKSLFKDRNNPIRREPMG